MAVNAAGESRQFSIDAQRANIPRKGKLWTVFIGWANCDKGLAYDPLEPNFLKLNRLVTIFHDIHHQSIHR